MQGLHLRLFGTPALLQAAGAEPQARTDALRR